MNISSPADYYELHLKDYLYVIKKRRSVIVFIMMTALILCLFFTVFEKVLYKATATILIEKENPNVVNFKEVMALDAAETEYYQTQYQLLRSRSLIEKLIEDQHLNEDPYFSSLREGRFRKILKNQAFLAPYFSLYLAPPTDEDLFNTAMLRIDPLRNSRLVEVSVLHPDPKKAGELANRLVELFIQRNVEDRFSISMQATELISKQLVDLKGRLAKAERNLQDYKEKNGLTSIPSIREKDKFVQEARLELVKIQAEESKIAKRYLPDHPKLIHIRSQIEGLQDKIKEEEEKDIGMSRLALNYQELEREAESARQIYETLLKRFQETMSEAKSQASNILFVDHASPPPKPYRPNPFLNFTVAFFVGALSGILFTFFLEYLDSTVKIPEDIEKGMGLNLFGIIPDAEKTSAATDGPKELFFDPSQHSPAAESIRALRTVLLFQLRHVQGSRVLLVTSPNPEEGKSSIALNLAAAFGQNNMKVILIDADLRKPKLHRVLKLPASPGLTDALEKQVSLKSAIRSNASGLGFDFLSCGTMSHHPTELLGSRELKEILQALNQEYDIVIFDTPPYLAVADVSVLSEEAAGIVLVTLYQKTDRRHLHDVKRRFTSPSLKALGVVINKVSVKERDYYYHQYYYYGYGNPAPPQ